MVAFFARLRTLDSRLFQYEFGMEGPAFGKADLEGPVEGGDLESPPQYGSPDRNLFLGKDIEVYPLESGLVGDFDCQEQISLETARSLMSFAFEFDDRSVFCERRNLESVEVSRSDDSLSLAGSARDTDNSASSAARRAVFLVNVRTGLDLGNTFTVAGPATTGQGVGVAS